MNTLQVAMVFVFAGVFDVTTTLIGLSRGLIESNPHVLKFPFMATIFLLVWSLFVPRISAHNVVKKLITVWMVVLAFVPSLWNVYLILVFT
jgi:hypothetical protein